jgi:hypothetical protein
MRLDQMAEKGNDKLYETCSKIMKQWNFSIIFKDQNKSKTSEKTC